MIMRRFMGQMFVFSVLFVGLFAGKAYAEGLLAPVLIGSPADDFEYFFNFRLTHFAPDTEPLISETFGDELKIIYDESFWEHRSYTSCAVGFATSLAALSVIEFGETEEYGQATTQSDSYYYQHLHYIQGLKPNTTYHYRIKVQDYDGNLLVSGDHAFKTQELTDDVILIPDDFEGKEAPFRLNREQGKYVLTQDITARTVGLVVAAHNVTIDLDGHTLVYDEGEPEVTSSLWSDYAYDDKATAGIRAAVWNKTNVKVFNGTIRQGANGGTGLAGYGFNPIFFYHLGEGSYNEIAGVTVDYYGPSVTGIAMENGHAHHNVVIDRGRVIDNRHQGIKALSMGSGRENIAAYNSLRRFRQMGIVGSGHIHHNELYSDSFDSNSFLTYAGANGRIEDNKMFGMGYNPVGTNWQSNLTVRSNFIYLHGTAPEMRSTEYPRLSAIAGLRYTLYSDVVTIYENTLYEDNTIVLKAWEGCDLARGIWTASGHRNQGLVYRRNTVKVESLTDNHNFEGVDITLAAVDINGLEVKPGAQLPEHPIVFEDNRLIGNVNLVCFGSSYGTGGSTRFYRTRLERIPRYDSHFAPFRIGWWNLTSRDNYMIDPLPGEGVDIETPHYFRNEGYMELYYGYTKNLLLTDDCKNEPLSNKEITITTPGLTPITASTDNDGIVTFEMLTVRHLKVDRDVFRTDYTPYTFAAEGYTPSPVATQTLMETDALALEDPECTPTGTHEIENNGLFISPNPADTYFTVKGLTGNETLRLTDTSGRLLLARKLKDRQEAIDVTHLPAGLYYVQITGPKPPQALKLLVR